MTYDISVIWNTMIVSYIKFFSDTTYLEFSWIILNVWHLQCHHTLSAGCAASVTSGCKSPTYREANWGEFEGPDLSDKENHLAQKWWTQFFWGSPHACTTIIMYIYIYEYHPIIQSSNFSIHCYCWKAKRHFFPLRPPNTLQGLKDWGRIKLFSGWFYQISVTSSCVLQSSLSIKKHQVLHAFSCDVFSSMFWKLSSDETSEERHSKSSSKKVYKLL